MPSPWLRLAAQAIPWDRLLKQAPAIINAASSLVTKADAPRNQPRAPTGDTATQPSDIEQRLEALEERDQVNARVVKQIANQLEVLTRSLEVANARLRIALVGAGLSIIVIIIFGIILLA